ncbi:hypothetical protein psyc5s11_03370 [Clostridium gelidum]|uniref:Uncharacterized protein n=1 Tax=Clostridium gelidum TaxID=704125 RepID=A0ABN6ITT2_9CLOT|nr:hypothetical protein [Clostridium gelidum]BCZ44270.1 hypothetical protein psyc5s11_03370 [Clostridium gelidum]
MIASVSKDFIKRDLKSIKDRKRNFNRISTLFNESEKNNFTIDDQTWDDLIIDEEKLNLF